MARPRIAARGGAAIATASVAGLAAAYFVAGKFGLSLALVNTSTTAVWPPTGISLAALLLLGNRVWPGVLLGAFLTNLTTTGDPASSVGIAIGNTLEALVGARLVTSFANGARAFERPQDVIKFAILAALGSTVVSATIGTLTLAVAGFARWSELGPIWTTWLLGDASGAWCYRDRAGGPGRRCDLPPGRSTDDDSHRSATASRGREVGTSPREVSPHSDARAPHAGRRPARLRATPAAGARQRTARPT